MHRLSLFAAAFAGIAMPALAQQNEVYIEQRGTGNQLTIDQSEAENSRVGGLTIGRVLGATPSSSRRGPILTNILNIEVPTSQTALQSGGNNEATVTIQGGGAASSQINDVGLVQTGLGNSASVNANGSGLLGSVAQAGLNNVATLDLLGEGSTGSVLQVGIGNNANLSVSGGNEGLIGQFGRNNDSGTVVVDGVGTSVTVIQAGNNLAPVNGQGVSVISNAASVTITQTGFGTGN